MIRVVSRGRFFDKILIDLGVVASQGFFGGQVDCAAIDEVGLGRKMMMLRFNGVRICLWRQIMLSALKGIGGFGI